MKKGFSVGFLKWAAVICMFLDHVGLIFFELPSVLGGTQIGDMMDVPLRAVGRMSFPIFLFCLLQGYLYTHDRAAYTKRLLLFAFISEIPYDFGNFGRLWSFVVNNVIWTMFLIVVMWMCYEKAAKHKDVCKALYGLIFAFFMFIAYFTHVDYGQAAIGAATALYAYRSRRVFGYFIAITVLAVFVSPIELFALLSLPLIKYYNHTKGRQIKYFFYIFYPVHLIFLRLLYMLLFP